MEAISVGSPLVQYPILLTLIVCGSKVVGKAPLSGRIVVSEHGCLPHPQETRLPQRLQTNCQAISPRHHRENITIIKAGALYL